MSRHLSAMNIAAMAAMLAAGSNVSVAPMPTIPKRYTDNTSGRLFHANGAGPVARRLRQQAKKKGVAA
jgi:hypothetical protein